MARRPAMEAVQRAARKAAAGACDEDVDVRPPVAEAVSLKPVVRIGTRSSTRLSRASYVSSGESGAGTPTVAVQDVDDSSPAAEAVAFKPLIRRGTRNHTSLSRSSYASCGSGPSTPPDPAQLKMISETSAVDKTPTFLRQITGGLAMLTKGKSNDLRGGGLGGFLTKQFSKGSLDKRLKPRICLEELREMIHQNLAEEPSLKLFDYYKTEGVAQLIAKSTIFENVTLFVIALNAIWMAVDTTWNTSDSIVDADPVFIVAENAFCIYFTVEWVIRLMAFERKLYGLNSNWFIFDTVLVVMMVLETWVAVGIVLLLDDDSFSLGDVAILRLLRLMRLSRLVRMLRALPELLILVKGALRAMKTVAFVISLLLAITYVFGVAMVLLLKGTPAGDDMFSTVPQAMYSLLLYGTLLDSLVLACAKLEESSVVSLVVFFVYVALAALTVLNMLIGVLCEMVSVVAHQEKDRMLTTCAEEKLALVIKELDQDEDFRLSKQEFLSILVNPTAAQALADIGVDPIGVIDFADLIFSNEVGQETDLSFEEFMEVILQLRGSNSSTVRHMVELKHMIAQQLDDLTRQVQEHQEHMAAACSCPPAPFQTEPAGRLACLRPGEGAETPPGRASADAPMVSQDLPPERGVGHSHRACDELPPPPGRLARATCELAPDVPPMASEDAAGRAGGPSFVPRAASPASQRPGALSPRGSACSSCPSHSDGPDLSEELSALSSRTQRIEDTLAEVFAEVKKLSAMFATDASPCGDVPSIDEQVPLAGSVPLPPLVIPGVPVPATPLGG
ncbi:unnamed protein product [Prorocentrum cordatum]|uniref:Ion transport domain-containing protein n=1 Tax=Prorocentrum cordatum TaxID=2364126 RepID=A0ABN9UGP2_9DINO|nr:unnamed protein product [Polarella glacialis]